MTDFADNLRALMLKRGLEQGDIATLAKVSQGAVSRWLAGKREPSSEILLRVAQSLKVEVSELLRAPSGMRTSETKGVYDEGPHFEKWFRQARASWKDHPEERHRIKTGIELTWPNQSEEILEWLEQQP